ncbi:MAG: CsgG/HfaB family protein [Bacteroidales bacterium]
MRKTLILTLLFTTLFLPGLYAQNEVIQEQLPVQENESYKGLKRKVAILRFSNETQYGKGIFYDKENDPMAKQALDILSSKLASSGKFMLLERNDLSSILEEANRNNVTPQAIGADYVIVGSLTEFGRKNVGDAGVFRSSKEQIVEAGVNIRIVDTSTGLIIYSEEGRGKAQIKTKQTLGIGGKAGYDATLSDKAISMAISQLVENIINNCTNKPWKAYFMAYDEDAVIISGGESQGVKPGDNYLVMQKGKTVKNPATGINIELPGKPVGKISVLSTGGDTAETEYSLVTFTEGSIDKEALSNYYIQEMNNE